MIRAVSDTPLDALDDDRRFVPSIHRQTIATPDQWVRYGWAATLAEHAKVLDVGCGSGWGTALLASGAEHVTGIDISAPAVAVAAKQHSGNVSFLEADLRSLPFDDGSFDMVVCFETLEQLSEGEAEPALEELRRVLRPEGLLLISVANRGVYPPGNPLHLQMFSSEELEWMLQVRFANVAVHRQCTYWTSFLGSESALREDDPRLSIEAEVGKSSGADPGHELYAVAVATDGGLPPAPTRLVLGGIVDYEQQRKLLATWQDRALKAEMDAVAIRTEIDFLRFRQQETAARADAAEKALAHYREHYPTS
jgi:SAM-dependent methyltransferase